MRVLFIISTLNAGGAERVMSLLASYFSNFHDVSLLKFDTKEPFYKLDSRINLINLPYPMQKNGFFINLNRRIKKFFYQRELIKKGEFDIVISFMDSTNINVILSKFFLKTPLIISEHSSSNSLKSNTWVALRRVFYPFANGLTLLSKSDFEYYKFVNNRVVMYNPMFELPQTKIEKSNTILFVGRLVPLKGCDIFLKALGLIRQDIISNYKIQIAGSGSEEQSLKALAKTLNLNVDFLGSIKDISKLYSKAKIIVSSSKTEGLPNVLIESIFFECARIATKTTGACELIDDGVDGLLVDIDDKKALSNAILKLINNDELRLKFIKNANKKQEQFKIETIYKKWMEFIQKCLTTN